jgi:murein DD-endopeptidase MepM/ murein hydrolase activator NlpD
LRSPLEFSRVTSGFTLARYHPILKKSRPHLGVDFGAPTGTPIRAVADGKVETAGKAGGHGNYVKIQHLGPQATSYSHLSKIAVQRGATVRQGQIIGYVGATGLATGPHLHYQMWVNGRHVNPMTVDLPMTESLSPADRSRFEAEKARLFALLDPGSPPVADAAAE